jgi:nucleoside-diphosphate-sugar epimerase
MELKRNKQILVTGGAGYVGSVLVPKLLKKGWRVHVLDLFLYGEHVFDDLKGSAEYQNLVSFKGDLRDQAIVKQAVSGCDTVIHLACISNDPSFELDPHLGRSINYDAFIPLVKISKEAGVKRFVYASTSSVYGISESDNVTEDHPLVPMTDYSKYKSMCEPILLAEQADTFVPIVIRPATVCGYSPRLRLDLTVNILTNHAISAGKIKVFGGSQKRPNIHIDDMADLYVMLAELPDNVIAGKIYNAGYENHTVLEIANMVKNVVQNRVPGHEHLAVEMVPSDDLRSYHISSGKIRRELGFIPKRTVENAVEDLVNAFQAGKIPNSMTDIRYFNIKTMQAASLK